MMPAAVVVVGDDVVVSGVVLTAQALQLIHQLAVQTTSQLLGVKLPVDVALTSGVGRGRTG
jgi:hypothetical protein